MPDPAASSRESNARLGLILFAIYLAFYLGFVLTSAFSADTMDTIVFAGLNLAIVYGFALIVIAFVMAMIYGFMCRTDDDSDSPDSTSDTDSEGQA